jgi:hypothetical protein
MSRDHACTFAPAQVSCSLGSWLAAYLYLRISKEQINGLKLRQNWPQCFGLMPVWLSRAWQSSSQWPDSMVFAGQSSGICDI